MDHRVPTLSCLRVNANYGCDDDTQTGGNVALTGRGRKAFHCRCVALVSEAAISTGLSSKLLFSRSGLLGGETSSAPGCREHSTGWTLECSYRGICISGSKRAAVPYCPAGNTQRRPALTPTTRMGWHRRADPPTTTTGGAAAVADARAARRRGGRPSRGSPAPRQWRTARVPLAQPRRGGRADPPHPARRRPTVAPTPPTRGESRHRRRPPPTAAAPDAAAAGRRRQGPRGWATRLRRRPGWRFRNGTTARPTAGRGSRRRAPPPPKGRDWG